ncbi:hypothetical protein U9M48_002099 [Paspalum notatum var. saurae]|uniref:Protein kinase domain-containing protein n=1 Tax=Paspalum notatum var. saurae TaxID=547442 RepID=A0AAQ3PH99_PASNO
MKILPISWPCAWRISMLTLLTNILFVSPLSTNYSDFLALMSFKSHITDPKQALSSWDAASSNNTNTPDFCQWMGVTCGDRHHPGRVTAIRLQDLGLAGIISEYLGNLTQLHFLDLSSNKLVGDIPSRISNCRKLRTINLNANLFSGFVPGPFGLLSKLTVFNVSHNNLTGEILTTLSNLTALVTIDTDRNAFNGQIPSRLSNLTSLSDLFLAKNSFSGNVPADLGKITNLVTFDVMKNNLEGIVPPSIFNISSLLVLNLGFNKLGGSLPLDIGFKLPRLIILGTHENNNQFEGPIPASLSNASELGYLFLRGNRYRGLIPRDIGIHGNLKVFSVGHNELQASTTSDWDFLTSLTNCSKLNILDLEQNNFAGVMPNSIANLSQELQWLTFGGNHLAGTPALSLRRLRKLTNLFLNDNLFTGTLPIDIGQLSSLQNPDLSNNRFEGQIPIPVSLGNLSNLEFMDLSYHLLRGQIPREIFTITSLTICLSLSNNALSGTIPKQIGQLNSLSRIDLSMNKLYLQRKIPKRLNTLGVLEKLDLSSNNLTGPIPNFLETIRTLNYLNLSFNNLSGPVRDTTRRPPGAGHGSGAAPPGLGRGFLSTHWDSGSLPTSEPIWQAPSRAPRRPVHARHDPAGAPPPSSGTNPRPKLVLDTGAAFHYTSDVNLLHDLQEIPHQIVYEAGGHPLPVAGCRSIPTLGFSIPEVFLSPGRRILSVKQNRTGQPRPPTTHKATKTIVDLYNSVLADATRDFHEDNNLGCGATGFVYQGHLRTLDRDVAIKVMSLSQRVNDFNSEVKVITQLKHKNIVELVGWCRTNEKLLLVYELMAKGSLSDVLHKSEENLSWEQRYKIILDLGSALTYLHVNCKEFVFHGDIKP